MFPSRVSVARAFPASLRCNRLDESRSRTTRRRRQTGFRDLDSLICGFNAGELVILGGSSGSGRSAFARSVALYTARHGGGVAIFSYKTTRETVTQRLISALTSVPLQDLRGGTVSREDWPRLIDIGRNPVWSRLHIVGSASLSVGQVEDRVRQISEERPRDGWRRLSLVVVGPLRLMGPVAPATKEERNRQLAATVMLLKRMALRLRVPVLLIGDLDLEPGDRDEERPRLSDLEQSSAARSFADKVLLLSRTSSGSESGSEEVAEMYVARYRNGETGSVKLGYQEDYGVFRSLPARGPRRVRTRQATTNP